MTITANRKPAAVTAAKASAAKPATAKAATLAAQEKDTLPVRKATTAKAATATKPRAARNVVAEQIVAATKAAAPKPAAAPAPGSRAWVLDTVDQLQVILKAVKDAQTALSNQQEELTKQTANLSRRLNTLKTALRRAD